MASAAYQERLNYYASLMEKLQNDHILTDISERDKILNVYPLQRIHAEDIEEIRASGIPSFILKQTIIPGHPEYWYTPVSEKFSLVAKKWFPHNCGDCSLLGSKEGSSLHRCVWAKTIKQAINIEKFDYLENAVITFGIHGKLDVLKIKACSHFKPYEDEPKWLSDLRAQS